MIANPSKWSDGFDVDDGRVADDGVGSVAEGSKQNGSGDKLGLVRFEKVPSLEFRWTRVRRTRSHFTSVRRVCTTRKLTEPPQKL